MEGVHFLRRGLDLGRLGVRLTHVFHEIAIPVKPLVAFRAMNKGSGEFAHPSEDVARVVGGGVRET